MEKRHTKAILKAYNAEKLKILKALISNNKNKLSKLNLLKAQAKHDAYSLYNHLISKKDRPKVDNVKFNTWLSQEYSNLKSSWIQETELTDLGFSDVIKARENLLKTMEQASHVKNLAIIKKQEAKVNCKQMHVD